MTTRRQRWLAAFLIAFALGLVVVSVRQGSQGVRIADFTLFYAAATLLGHGHPLAVYDLARTGPEVLRLSNGTMDPSIPFSYPLATALPIVPLTVLPLQVAFRVWQGVILLTLVAAIWLLQRTLPLGLPARRWAMLGTLAAIPTWALLTEGQFSALPLLGAAALVRAIDGDRPGWGLAGGTLLALKPQYLPAFLVVLWASRCRRSLMLALLGAGLVTLSPGIIGGPAGMTAMAHSLAYGGNLTAHADMDNWAGLAAVVLPPGGVPIAGLLIFAAGLAVLLTIGWRRWVTGLALVGVVGCVAVLESPHTLLHDEVLLMIPAWAGFTLAGQGRLPSPLYGLGIMQAAWLIGLHGLPVSVAPVALTAVLAGYVVAFRRRAAAQSPVAAAA
jgi:hypothetical protein